MKIEANPIRYMQCLTRQEFRNDKVYCYTGSTTTYMDWSVSTKWDTCPISVMSLSNGGVLDEDNYNRIMRGEPLREDKPWWRFW